MAPVPRETVLQAVDLYGRAWTTQNIKLLPSLFTVDAIYIERVFDKNATFRGLDAIIEYWKYQIAGKQSNIAFRHVVSELIRDADEPKAVVTWLAEFDNVRANRAEKTHKKVRFCQVAKLTFRDDKVCCLEEYCQSMTGPGVRWPGIGEEVSEVDIQAKMRMNTIQSTTKEVKCDICQRCFPSRTQLFRHLKSTTQTEEGTCVQIKQTIDDGFDWLCVSLGYLCSEGVEDALCQALDEVAREQEMEATSVDVKSLIWAVTTRWSYSAVVNVASIRLSRALLISIEDISRLAALLNRKLPSSIRVHKTVVVDRPCVQARRFFEKYEYFIPWSRLQSQGGTIETENKSLSFHKNLTKGRTNGWSKQSSHCRRPLCETDAFPYLDLDIVKRLRDGSRLLRDCGRTDLGHFEDAEDGSHVGLKVRVRTQTMEAPWHRFCRISVSIRQRHCGTVDQIISLLLSYARSSMSNQDLRSSALELSTQDQINTSATCIQYLCLLEPCLTTYEGKIGVKLCGDDNKNVSNATADQDFEESIENMEVAILSHLSTRK